MTDEEKVCKAICNSDPCKILCTKAKCYLGELVEERAKKIGELALNYIENLKKENAELKKDKEWLDNTNNEQTEVILKLNEQIEKMKCCENCRHNYFDNEEIRHCDVLNQHQMVVFKKCDKWELAE